MEGHALMIMVAYNGRKALKDVEFHHIPIWIRVSNLPMGMMNKEAAVIIGNEVGQFLDVDVEENGTAAGRYLRLKVKIDIRMLVMRGITLEIEEEEEGRWCPLEYEFLPEFCYSCGIIGHVDRNCPSPLNKGGKKEFGQWLRVLPPKRRFLEEIFPKGGPFRRAVRSDGDWRREKEERKLPTQSVDMEKKTTAMK